MDALTFAKRYLYPYKMKGSEIVPKHCPFCKGGSHHDKETFALNIDKLTYNCKRGSCGEQGHFSDLCKKFGEEMDRQEYIPVKQYKKPKTNVEPATNAVEKYLSLRKISKKSIDHYKVGCDDKGNIVFPYYENGELVMLKFRPSRKVEKGERKAWREEGGKPVLWGMQNCTGDQIVITEGEIDALSCYEVGIENVVSVPSGSEELAWIDLCWDWLKQFKSIVIFGDNDEPGREMVNKLKLKLSDWRLYTVENKYKDANELLYRDGPEAVLEAVKNAKEVPVYGLLNLAEVKPIDVSKIPKVLSNNKFIDKCIGGFLLGDLSVWTGKRGEGKSTYVGQLTLEAIDQGNSVCVYSGELSADRFQYWIHLQAAGEKYVSRYYDNYREQETYYVEKEIQDRIKAWYNGKFWVYDNRIAGKTEESSILNIFEYAVKRYDCKWFVVDNLMSAGRSVHSDEDYYRAQSNFAGHLDEFAKKYNVHVHLIAHPKKTAVIEDCDDVSGLGDITNTAANVFGISRVADEDKAKINCDTVVKILKNRWEGKLDRIGMNYCKASRRLYLPSVGNVKQYGWEKIQYKKEWWEEIPEGETPF